MFKGTRWGMFHVWPYSKPTSLDKMLLGFSFFLNEFFFFFDEIVHKITFSNNILWSWNTEVKEQKAALQGH